ncbi:class I SAM-dependent methyltransferase [Changchengzhania lutea]|uniref:class I SAM-dependent methyltransferase n=1 Tax=Changchengzhania lutea TaxID=2049305 RepID=UPI00115E4D2F|nr:class I SAM-dependent methyltransferase [Changchengzhania lutea]
MELNNIIENSFPEDFETEVYKGWSQVPIYATRAEKYVFEKHLKDNSYKTLEAGTGGGRIAFFLEAELHFKNITAFDLVPKLIEHCKLKAIERDSNIEFLLSDVSNVEHFENQKFENILYTGQVLCMLPKHMLNDALLKAYTIGDTRSCYIFTFMDWDSRWYNPILSFLINFYRTITFQKLKIFYIPEVTQNARINKNFFNSKGYSILWIKKKHAIKKLEAAGFQIKSTYRESELKNGKGSVLFFICKKI